MFSGIGAPELLIVLLILVFIFGGRKLPGLMRSVGQSVKELKQGMKEGFDDQPVEGPCPFCGAQVAAESKFCPGCAKSAEDIVAEKDKQAKKTA
ncbi:MAG: twin-arginine translocase TatA/TatE family subunit [Actinobacteria bacterium]|nr:twin-arginine translocase TatA/TatE family subunit [Actinomycetota bacterium]